MYTICIFSVLVTHVITTMYLVTKLKKANVIFNFDPFPRNKFFRNIWTHSENFVPTIGQPDKGESVYVSGGKALRLNQRTLEESTTCVSIIISTPQWPHAAFKMRVCHKI